MARLRAPTILLAAIGVICQASPAVAGDGRSALVIGNGAYSEGALANPIRDAKAVAEKLKAVGFEVTVRTDLGRKGMRNAVNRWAQGLGDAGTALVFYAGHGVELGGVNYLLPVDFGADNDVDAKDDAYRLAAVFDHLAKRLAGTNIVIVDACRNDPWSRGWSRTGKSRGLAVVERVPSDTYVAFSAKPGQTASEGAGKRHSPFTAALLDHLDTPGLELDMMFRKVRADVRQATSHSQDPWTRHDMTGSFYFAAATPGAAVEPPPPPRPTPAPSRAAPAERFVADLRPVLGMAAGGFRSIRAATGKVNKRGNKYFATSQDVCASFGGKRDTDPTVWWWKKYDQWEYDCEVLDTESRSELRSAYRALSSELRSGLTDGWSWESKGSSSAPELEGKNVRRRLRLRLHVNDFFDVTGTAEIRLVVEQLVE